MNINEAIVKYGTEAVRKYRAVAGLDQENKVPEIFLGGVIACGIHDALGLHAHVEKLYTTIAIERGVPISASLTNEFGGYRADVAVYQDGLPFAVVELKKFDDGKSHSSIVADRDKMISLSRKCGVECYIGVLVTDVESGVTCTERARALGVALGREFDVIGDKQPSQDGKWHWLFAGGKLA